MTQRINVLNEEVLRLAPFEEETQQLRHEVLQLEGDIQDLTP